MVELSHGLFRSLFRLYANLGLKVEFSAWLTEQKTQAVSYKPNIFSVFLVSKAETSAGKNLTDIFMNQSGLKEQGKLTFRKSENVVKES